MTIFGKPKKEIPSWSNEVMVACCWIQVQIWLKLAPHRPHVGMNRSENGSLLVLKMKNLLFQPYFIERVTIKISQNCETFL